MRLLGRVLVVLAAVLVMAGGGLYLWLRTSLPRDSGTITVEGPTAPVQIVRDRNAIPHIYGQTLGDAYFGLGYAHAQDRLWQMEFYRRLGAGRLSELVGEAGFETDRYMRTLGFRRLAEETARNLTGTAREIAEGYTRGVNAFLATRQGPLPPEFLLIGLLGAGEIEPWQPADSLTFNKIMALDLSGNVGSEMARMRLAKVLSPRQIAELFPPYPGDAPVALADLGDLYREAGRNIDLAALETLLPEGPTSGIGSNNWVVGSAGSASGKPLLANDPHLGLSTPSLWYLAHISAPGMEVIGATFPGVPGVVLGRNRSISWGFTNTGPDTQDLYLEKIDPANPAQYITPDGPRPFETRTESIRIRGGAERTVTIRNTRHGPVMSDLARFGGVPAEGFAIALRWTALDPNDRTSEAIEGLSRARSWDEVLASLRLYSAPMQNIVFADAAGNIGFIAPGKVPVRKPENDLYGLAPAPGWDARYDWTGYIPFDELPRTFNPPRGSIVTANNKIVPDSYAHFLTSEWSEPYRAIRIGQLIAGRETHSPDSFKAMQADTRSLMAVDLLAPMLALLPAGLKPRAAEARAMLAGWNGQADADRPEPLLFAAWYREFSRRLYGDELGDPLFNAQWRFRPLFVRNVLANVDGQGRWCDDTRTPDVETCSQIAVAALEAAADGLRQRYGDEPRRWTWGTAHTAFSPHRPFTVLPVVNRLLDIEVPSAGDAFTVNVGRFNIADEANPYRNVHSGGLRAVYDMADADRAWFMISTGQSGNPLSPHYRNLAKPWAAVDYLLVSMRRAEIDAGAQGTLTLQPR
jgi:penicillin amidase